MRCNIGHDDLVTIHIRVIILVFFVGAMIGLLKWFVYCIMSHKNIGGCGKSVAVMSDGIRSDRGLGGANVCMVCFSAVM